MGQYYADHSHELRRALGEELPTEELKRLHQKRPLFHALIAASLFATLAGSTVAIVHLDLWFLWLPFAVVSGFALFNCTVLLHEVVHRTVLGTHSDRISRLIGLLYAVLSGISSSQFTRWHLDHHANLGSYEDDPKRHYLSPKRNERWVKLLYFTPALFPIYFRAAREEARIYEPELQRQIRLERTLTIGFHLTLLAAVIYFAGFYIGWKTYIVP